MAQLPPKIPTMAPCFSHHKAPSMTLSSHPSWIDDFLDFSSSRRSAHRRSASDSATFFEECRTPPPANHDFDRLDDDQLMSMFSDDNATTSTPSDHDSANDTRPKGDAAEVQSSCKYEPSHQLPPLASESNVDPKRVKRILANRQSAQRSRVRKLQYISELERSVTSLQTEVSTLSPRVAYLDHQRLILNVDNSALKQRIAALAQDKIFKDAHQEALKKELERLRQVYQQQNQENMGNNINATNNTSVDIIEHEQQDHQK